jgi:endonuclease YncB( thermonuclease family)
VPTVIPFRRRRRSIVRPLLLVCAYAAVGIAWAAFFLAPSSNLPRVHRPALTSQSSAPARVRVIDGDTIRDLAADRTVRLVGFNAPETLNPQCAHEAELGERAKARLKELARSNSLRLTYVRCSCPLGTEGTDACNYGRACGELKADGEDVGSTLMREGLAVSFVCGGTRCPRTPRPWC